MTAATATAPETEAKPARIEGYLDAVDGKLVHGWAWDRDKPEERLGIELWFEGRLVATACADQLRADLRGNGIGDGHHAFAATLGDSLGSVAAEALTAYAVPPDGGERVVLKLRGAADEAAAMEAMLRRLNGTAETIVLGQRQLAAALRNGLRQTAAADMVPLERTLAEIAGTQAALQKQIAGIEVFLLRFEALMKGLSNVAESKAAPQTPPRAEGLLARLFGAFLSR